MGKKLSFLFGSGVSRPAKINSTDEITDIILSGQKAQNTQNINKILDFLRKIKMEVESFYHERKINYEDIYMIAAQIHDYAIEYINPIVQPFVEKIKIDLSDTLKSPPPYMDLTIESLADKACDYIVDVVALLLNQPPSSLAHFEILNKAYHDKSLDQLNIFTLNHDKLVEEYFTKAHIPYCDGFERVHGELIDFWNPNMFQNFSKGIKLLKIHGSIDWYRYRYNGLFNDFYGKSDDKVNNWNGYEIIEDRPLILVGTFNKILEYERKVFSDLQYFFYELLNKSDILIVSGYSFGDKGINSKIIHWMNSAMEHKILVIDPSFEKCNSPAIKNVNWPEWDRNGRAIYKNTGLEGISWCNVKEFF